MWERGSGIISEDLILTHLPSEMEIPQVKIDVDVAQAGDDLDITLLADGFAHFVSIDHPDGAIPTDNYFNLLPNRPKLVRVTGARPDQVKINALNAKP
jgi:hypothetical protein